MAVEKAFGELTSRKDIAILLINQHVRLVRRGRLTRQIAETIRHVIDDYKQVMPALLEIPSKDHPYDPEKDSILKHVNRLFSQE